MSELAERLRRLRSQAGARIESAPSAPTAGEVGISDGRASISTVTPDASSAAASNGLKSLLRRHLRGGAAAGAAVGEDARCARGGLIGGECAVCASRGTPCGRRAADDSRLPHACTPRGEAKGNTPAPLQDCRGAELSPGLFEYTECLPLAPPASWQWLPDLHPQLLPTEGLLHFDTETTGLAGGTGTRAFMVGYARWRAARLEVRQLWISRLSAEASMLERFALWLSEDACQLVSYNGRSFDAPLLRARYRLCRMRDPLLGLPHHDLLHPVRRRFRRQWPNCRLAEAEARLLGVRRQDDLAGAQAPAAFLTSLRSGDPRPLERVRRHHFQDLVSLAGLLPKLCAFSAQAPTDWRLA